MHVAIIGYFLHENKACSILCTLYRPINRRDGWRRFGLWLKMGGKNFLEGLAVIFDLIELFQKSQNNNFILIEKSKKFREKNDWVFS